ncbi:MAG: GntR family transcriptional regulator [Methylobacterium sp.]|nr:GntR family transcriptional regulator [Methylobacterium sp.]MCA3652508.1 GntR family transcriptional regulator [Methylobacterium sp.]MCA4921396.1 GntR family transcriptional regulator [Methylobacterium sp.]
MTDTRKPAHLAPKAAESPGLRPLYRQVKELLSRRIADQVWQPGELIPSEHQIAAELGVSQGTVRKALDEMTAERLLTRRQGRGTFVARHDEARILFQFFKLAPDDGVAVFPESELRRVTKAPADADERRALGLGPGQRVIRIARLRSLAGKPVISEYLSLPERLFPGLGEAVAVENNLYDLFASRFGITVAGARERVKAVLSSPEDAELLGLESGAPVLAIDRIATAIDGAPVEWRRSLCRTDECSYVNTLR